MSKLLLIVFIVVVLGGAAYFVMQRGNTYSSYQMTAVSTPAPSLPSGAPIGMVKSFTVSGTEFAFTPNTLSVNKGDTVKILFTNNGKFPHNFTITEFNVQSKTISHRESDTVIFTPD